MKQAKYNGDAPVRSTVAGKAANSHPTPAYLHVLSETYQDRPLFVMRSDATTDEVSNYQFDLVRQSQHLIYQLEDISENKREVAGNALAINHLIRVLRDLNRQQIECANFLGSQKSDVQEVAQ